MIYFFLLAFSTMGFSSTSQKCLAQYDEMGIPHQKVESIQEYYYCFGYHHGKDRAWEMDFFRRVVQGRNAEVYGYTHLKNDLLMKLLDLPALAQKLYDGLPDTHKNYLQSYSDGANQGFLEGKKSQEFLDLDYEPEEWRPVDSISILVLQSFDQTRKTFYRDYEEEKFKEFWKEKSEALFSDDDSPWFNTILKEGEYPKGPLASKTTEVLRDKPPKLWAEFPEVFGKESGSNNWVVSKEKSKNGYAMLANDPHLDLKTPLFWYWIQLKTPGFSVMGASVPGVPVIPSGTNGKVAWGLTNSYIKTGDVAYIKEAPSDYIESFRPVVQVKLGIFKLPFFFKQFEKTKDGRPLLPLEVESGRKMALIWSGFDLKSEDIVPMFELMHPKNVTEMDEVLKGIGLPAWNLVFADHEGHIGYRMIGNGFSQTEKKDFGIPEKTPAELKSIPYLSPMERPHVLRPARNYIYSANNRHWPVDSKFYGGRGYSHSFRGYKIDHLLKSQQHDVESFKNIQCDTEAVDATFFVKKILSVVEATELKGWDFSTAEGLLAPSLYRRFMDLMLSRWHVNEFALYRLLDQLTADQKKEMAELYEEAREDVGGRSWGDLHRLTFIHLSQNGDWVFSPELPGFGDNHSVNPGTSKWNDDLDLYEHFSGASMRMIIVLKPELEIHLSLPGLNRNYTQKQEKTSSWKQWQSCQYNRIYF